MVRCIAIAKEQLSDLASEVVKKNSLMLSSNPSDSLVASLIDMFKTARSVCQLRLGQDPEI